MATQQLGLSLATLLLATACQFQPGSLGQRDGAVDDDDAGDAPAGPSDVLLDAPSTATDAPFDAVVVKVCPASYSLTNNGEPGSKYRLVTASDDWAAAEADCENDSGTVFQPAHLVVLDDAAERIWVYQQGTTDKWIGATDLNTEGTLQAVTDQAAPHFGNPLSQEQSKDCMFTNQNDTVMESCSSGFQYICECDGLAADPTNF